MRLTTGKPAFAHWIGDVETRIGYKQSARSFALRQKVKHGGQVRHEMESIEVAARNARLSKRWPKCSP